MNPAATALEILRWLLDKALELAPHEVVKDELDQAAIRRANAIADAAEAEKFP